ncbi:MAG: hypothetical protein K6A23_12075 [Butyrivibrio sp.]|nr:hypothetical protein [Butyrivibrio sp.]
MSKDKEKKISKFNNIRALIAFFATIFILLGLCIVAVVYVDPFFQYHEPLEGFPYVVDNQLTQNPGMARHMDYDSVVVGSSMTVNFDTDDFADNMGLDTLKLCYNGAMPHDISNILDIVFDEDTVAMQNGGVDAVILCIDPYQYTAGIEDTKYPIPEYLYDKSVFNDIEYLLNKDVLLQYILRPVINNNPTDLSYVYSSWWTPDYYNIQWVMHTYTYPIEADSETTSDVYLPQTVQNLQTNILPYIIDNPDTVFYCFYAPYSVLFWNDCIVEKHLDASLSQYQQIADILLTYDNVRLFSFISMEEVVTDLNQYADELHYAPWVNTYMTECFADGTWEVNSSEEMSEIIEDMRRIIDEFDYETLFSTEW